MPRSKDFLNEVFRAGYIPKDNGYGHYYVEDGDVSNGPVYYRTSRCDGSMWNLLADYANVIDTDENSLNTSEALEDLGFATNLDETYAKTEWINKFVPKTNAPDHP